MGNLIEQAELGANISFAHSSAAIALCASRRWGSYRMDFFDNEGNPGIVLDQRDIEQLSVVDGALRDGLMFHTRSAFDSRARVSMRSYAMQCEMDPEGMIRHATLSWQILPDKKIRVVLRDHNDVATISVFFSLGSAIGQLARLCLLWLDQLKMCGPDEEEDDDEYE